MLFLILFCPRLSEVHTDVTRSYIYIIFQKMKAAGERSMKKRCIKKPVRRKELTLFGIDMRLSIINNTKMSVCLFFFGVLCTLLI